MVQSKRLYEDRDRLVERITATKENAKRETQDFEHELRDIIALKEKNASHAIAIAAINEQNRGVRHSKQVSSPTKFNAFSPEPEKTNEKEMKLKLDLAKLKVIAKTTNPAALVQKLEAIEEQNFGDYSSILSLAAEKDRLDSQIDEFAKKKQSLNALEHVEVNRRSENILQNLEELKVYEQKNSELERLITDFQGRVAVQESTFSALHDELAGGPREEEHQDPEERLSEVEKLLINLLVHVGHTPDPVT